MHKITKRSQENRRNSYRVRVGEVPFDMRGQELEYNILFLSEKYCAILHHIQSRILSLGTVGYGNVFRFIELQGEKN